MQSQVEAGMFVVESEQCCPIFVVVHCGLMSNNDTDDTKSSMISTPIHPNLPVITAPLGLMAATDTTHVGLLEIGALAALARHPLVVSLPLATVTCNVAWLIASEIKMKSTKVQTLSAI